MLQEQPTGTLLTDTTNLGAINEEDQVWSYTEWLEQALVAGYDTLVLIMSSDIFAQMAVEDIMEQANAATKGRVVNQYFDNEQDARAWIKQRSETVSQ
jgi:3D (Asp-Asp-Asp) domain-containing protein